MIVAAGELAVVGPLIEAPLLKVDAGDKVYDKLADTVLGPGLDVPDVDEDPYVLTGLVVFAGTDEFDINGTEDVALQTKFCTICQLI